MNMPDAPRTPGKWVLYRKSDGKRFERWPVDAKGMLSTGVYTREVPGTGVAGPMPVHPGLDPKSITPTGQDPVPHVAAAEQALESSPFKLMHNKPQEIPRVPEVDEQPPEEPVVAATELVEHLEADESLGWVMPSYTPEKYLRRWPKGPQAELARAVIAQQQ